MTDLFSYPASGSLYADDPRSIGASVEWACICCGLFYGDTAQRSDLLERAVDVHRANNDHHTKPEHETLGRELRHREGTRQHYYDRLLTVGWRIVCQDGRVWAERVAPPGAVANPGHACGGAS